MLAGLFVLASSRTQPLDRQEGATPGCQLFLAGRPLEVGSRPDRAIAVSASGTVAATGVDPDGTDRIELLATLAPDLPDRATWSVRRRSFDPPRPEAEVSVDMREVTGYSVGLVLVTIGTDSCRGAAWLDISDRPAVFTGLGLLGLTLVAAGVVAVAVNLWRSAPGAAGTFPGAIGAGLPYGVGVAVLSQQAGNTPLSPSTLAAWTITASAAAGLLHLARRHVAIWRRERREQGVQSGMRDER